MTTTTTDNRVSLPEPLIELLRRKIDDLRMLPGNAARALQIVKDPECSIRDFSAAVERDVKLAADMLRMANSVVYSPAAPVHTLPQAVVRLGFRQCQNLILTSSMASLVQRLTLQEEWVRDLLWRHSTLTALLSLRVNRALDLGFDGEEFFAGLIHDIGRILLALVLPDKFADIDPLQFDEDTFDTLAHEREIVGATHADVGAWFASHNQLPDEFIVVTQFHHQPASAAEYARLAALTAVADHMANYYQRVGETAGYEPESNPAIGLLESTGVHGATEQFSLTALSALEAAADDAEKMQ